MIVDDVEIHVTRKKMKTVRMRVSPPDAQVLLSVPNGLPESYIRKVVEQNMDKIRAMQEEILQQYEGYTPIRFLDGESHPFAGKDYTLYVRVRNAPPCVILLEHDSSIIMAIRPGSTREKREKILDNWYRQQLYEQVPGLLDKWVPRIKKSPAEVRVRKMRTRWGTCNTIERRIWLSLELAKKDPALLEYVMVHEMVHLLQPGHPPRFWQLMDKFLPDWKTRKNLLDASYSEC